MSRLFSESFQVEDGFFSQELVKSRCIPDGKKEEGKMAKERLYQMTEPQKNMLVIALLDERHRQQARGIKNPAVGPLAVRVDEAPRHKYLLPWNKEKLFDLYLDDTEWTLARDAINELRNQRFARGKGNGGTDNALLKLMSAKYKRAPDRD